jgi:hypothetical protein
MSPGFMATKNFQGAFFELAYPDEWELEIVENIPCLFDLEAGWVLQLAASSSEDGNYDLNSEFTRYLEINQIEFQEDRVVRYENASGLDCLAAEFMKDNRFWLVQMIASGPRLLAALFNSDQVPDGELAAEISATVGSIQFRD